MLAKAVCFVKDVREILVLVGLGVVGHTIKHVHAAVRACSSTFPHDSLVFPCAFCATFCTALLRFSPVMWAGTFFA